MPAEQVVGRSRTRSATHLPRSALAHTRPSQLNHLFCTGYLYALLSSLPSLTAVFVKKFASSAVAKTFINQRNLLQPLKETLVVLANQMVIWRERILPRISSTTLNYFHLFEFQDSHLKTSLYNQTHAVVFETSQFYSDPALMILNKPFTLLFLMACRQPAIT